MSETTKGKAVSEQVTRYDFEPCRVDLCSATMYQHRDGEYVRHADYDALRAERDALREALQQIADGAHADHQLAGDIARRALPHYRSMAEVVAARDAARRAALSAGAPVMGEGER